MEEKNSVLNPPESTTIQTSLSSPPPQQKTETEIVELIPVVPQMKKTSYQGRALFRKTLAFQKRQWFTNICCICLCPLFMVLISAGLGTVLLNAIQQGIPIVEDLLCSNTASLDAFNWPLYNLSDPGIQNLSGTAVPGSTQSRVKMANFFTAAIDATGGPPGAALFYATQPCVFWFSQNYPTSKIYEQNPNVTSKSFLRDSAYTAEPTSGWLNAIQNSSIYSLNPYFSLAFTQLQMRPWSLFDVASNVNGSAIGSGQTQQYSLAQFAFLTNGNDSFTNATSNSSFLSTIEPRYWLNYTFNSAAQKLTVNGFQKVPYFQSTDGENLDDKLGSAIRATIAQLASIDKSIFDSTNPKNTDLTAYFNTVSQILAQTPYGSIFFSNLDNVAKNYKWTLQFGNDKRLTASSAFPTAGKRQLLQQSQLDNAVLRNMNTSSGLSSAAITQGLRGFPLISSTKINFPVSGLIGRVLFPFGVSFLLPIFIVVLVKEKEDRILIMMKMNGMKSRNYMISQYITFYCLFLLSTAIFLIAGSRAKMELFTLTDPGLLIIVFLVWGHAQNAMAFFASNLFNKNSLALIISFLVVLCSVIIAVAIDFVFKTATIPTAYFIWPPFAFYRILTVLNTNAFTTSLQPYKFSMVKPGDEVFTALMFLWVEVIVFLVLAYYLNQTAPSEFGVRRPWNFPIIDLMEMFGNKQKVEELKISTEEEKVREGLEDDDVKAERARVLSNGHPSSSPLIMKGMRKVYASRRGLGPKLAVRDVSLAVEQGLIFGLLGPNGAGKTTLISILTGLYEASYGEATLAGYNIKTQTSMVYKKIGICPQFDILWDDLTISEHLYFYARLKGITSNQEDMEVEKCLQKVKLENFRDRKTKGLSGGEKRRLSIAIALIGDPAVVFLDEPTTGLDPEVRRLIWNIINESRENKTIILTTHSMEEAEALCQRIGIMAKGSLRCLGNPLRLKELYGSGFKLFFNSLAENTSQASAFVESTLPPGWKKLDSFTTNVSYEFTSIPGAIPSIFQTIEAQKEEKGILDWGISQTTLEEVFLRIISDSDAQG